MEEEVTLREEQEWIAANCQKFAGQWVALHGRNLLAAGCEAREVFLKVRGYVPRACVVWIPEDAVPFAGW
jgi:hypothetical protein